MKKIILFTIIITAIIIFLILFLSSLKRTPKTQVSQSTPSIATPTKTVAPTNVFPPTTPAQDQGGADKNYSNQMQYVLSRYPWYQKLPIQTTNYFVYFDLNKQEMIGEMYAKQNSLTQEQITNYENVINSQLSSFGVDLQKYPVNWQIDK